IPSSGRPTAGLDALRGTSGAGAASEQMAAGQRPSKLPSRGGQSRASSSPASGSRHHSSGPVFPGSEGDCRSALRGYGERGSSSRFSSPLSHAGHMLLG
ncbi:unnamed protein product, partial [Polarella glacialis]